MKSKRTIKSLISSSILRLNIAKKLLLGIIDKKEDNSNLRINIGGGYFFQRHWRVLDYVTGHYSYKPLAIDYIFNLMSSKPLPFKDNSVQFFYCSHTIEHIPQKFCQHIFNEIHRCLKKGGAFRITCPDYELAYRNYKQRNEKFFKTPTFEGDTLEKNLLSLFASYLVDKIPQKEIEKNLKSKSMEGFAEYYTNKIPLDSQIKNGGNHASWWTHKKMAEMLKKAGFKIIYKSFRQGSRFNEMKTKDFDNCIPNYSIFVEAIKV